MSKVTRPIGKMAKIRQAVLQFYPAAPVYGALGDMQTAGQIKRLTFERDALFVLGG
jgi:hypothetical protein